MPKAEQSSSTKADVKFAPRSLSNFAGVPNTVINHSYRDAHDGLSFLIFGNKSHGIPHEMVSEDQNILDAWGFVELHG